MGELPAINWLVDVAVTADSSYRSRIEDREGAVLTIAAPAGAGDAGSPRDGAGLELTWIAGRARYGVPVRLLGRTREWPPRWYVTATGTPVLKNRRRFVRGGGGEPVTVSTTERVPAVAFTGRVIDLSEGGARCRVPGTDLAVGEPVTVCIALPDATVRIAGDVLALRDPGESGGGCVDVVVTYQPPEPIARLLRRYVLAWELAERNGGRGPAVLATSSPEPVAPAPARATVHASHHDGARHPATHHDGTRHPSTPVSRPRTTTRPAPGATRPNRQH